MRKGLAGNGDGDFAHQFQAYRNSNAVGDQKGACSIQKGKSIPKPGKTEPRQHFLLRERWIQ